MQPRLSVESDLGRGEEMWSALVDGVWDIYMCEGLEFGIRLENSSQRTWSLGYVWGILVWDTSEEQDFEDTRFVALNLIAERIEAVHASWLLEDSAPFCLLEDSHASCLLKTGIRLACCGTRTHLTGRGTRIHLTGCGTRTHLTDWVTSAKS
ncbi:hypothetical protein NEOLEDRAFT_151539 [Neolentinus lepideus HHB14362 ss-1]|uniref:Uncharacterized protein n=1 Tax=Neolentinus lepideus HHB14362 ss-1 TaxID=1314782 RepID=A0A165MMZ3_9AGAM|nr:hypothetical protein NEOLEDRAFT_151539 [Neolentinus lepideus HHB14362 ss-1]